MTNILFTRESMREGAFTVGICEMKWIVEAYSRAFILSEEYFNSTWKNPVIWYVERSTGMLAQKVSLCDSRLLYGIMKIACLYTPFFFFDDEENFCFYIKYEIMRSSHRFKSISLTFHALLLPFMQSSNYATNWSHH